MGTVRIQSSQFECAHLCPFFFVVLVCVLSARALDTRCTDHDFMLAQGKTVNLHVSQELNRAQQGKVLRGHARE